MSIFNQEQLQKITEEYVRFISRDYISFTIRITKDAFADAMAKALTDGSYHGSSSSDYLTEKINESFRALLKEKAVFEKPKYEHPHNPRKSEFSGIVFWDYDISAWTKSFDKDVMVRYLDDNEYYAEDWLERLGFNFSNEVQTEDAYLFEAQCDLNVPIIKLYYRLEDNPSLSEEELEEIENELINEAQLSQKEIESWKEEFGIEEIER